MSNAARTRLVIVVTVPLVLAVGLWFVDPARAKWLPACPMHVLTGLDCPGCGSTRALHNLVHGQLLAAWRMNPLLVLLIAPLGYSFLREVIPGVRRRLKPVSSAPWVAWALLGAIVAFGIARNIPVYPLTLLAPH